jgi:hypothetical protein
MGTRSWLNNNPAVVTGAAVVLLVVSMLILYLTVLRSPGWGGDSYFYDRNTGQVFLASGPPPVKTAGAYQGEPAAVELYIFACGECGGSYAGKTLPQIREAGAKVGMFQKFSPQAKQQLMHADVMDQATMREGRLVQKPGTDQWVGYYSTEGQKLRKSMTPNCGDCDVVRCEPANQ